MLDDRLDGHERPSHYAGGSVSGIRGSALVAPATHDVARASAVL
jgi:hypothetical protein